MVLVQFLNGCKDVTETIEFDGKVLKGFVPQAVYEYPTFNAETDALLALTAFCELIIYMHKTASGAVYGGLADYTIQLSDAGTPKPSAVIKFSHTIESHDQIVAAATVLSVDKRN